MSHTTFLIGRCRVRFGVATVGKSAPGHRSPELARSGRPTRGDEMTSHRRTSCFDRWRARRAPKVPIPVQRPGIELVDGLTQVKHRVSTDELIVAGRMGSCTALCGMRVFVASLTDPGRRQCRRCS